MKGHSMNAGIWGKKVGMTQVFSTETNKVVPVTAIDVSNWFVSDIKTQERDGYDAIQVARTRKRYNNQPFSSDWLKDKKKYFGHVKEIKQNNAVENVTIGDVVDFETILEAGKAVDAFGLTIGRGFQGVMKRHGFAGGRASHGSMFKRRPGSLSFMRTRGRVVKGKKLPGHMGNERTVMRNLEVVRLEPEARVVLVKGSIPGKSGSLVFLRKVAG
jgi:large subunit ribosomal protein L3